MSEEICEGVQMLLDRMQNNPEDFDYEGRLYGYRNTMEEVLRNPPANQPMWYLNQTEIKALIDGYTAMHKQKFTAQVVHDILRPAPEYDINMDRPYQTSMRLDSSGNLGIGTQKPSKIIAPASMVKQAREILKKEFEEVLNQEFEKEYAKNRNT
jgi:hypothetical protein